jgi:hypothetical protein
MTYLIFQPLFRTTSRHKLRIFGDKICIPGAILVILRSPVILSAAKDLVGPTLRSLAQDDKSAALDTLLRTILY